MRSPNQASDLEVTSAKPDEASPEPSSAKKRPASEIGIYDDKAGSVSHLEATHNANGPSSKRLKGADSSKDDEASELTPLEPGSLATSLPTVQAPSTTHAGWNRGISGGLRTSFAGKDKLRKPLSQRASESPVQPPVKPQGPGEAASTETEPLASPLSEQQSNGTQSETSRPSQQGNLDAADWTLPPPQPPASFELRQKDQRAWEERFVAWCRTLNNLNGGKIKADTPKERNRLTEAYLKWIGTIDGLSKGKAAVARRTAVHHAQDNSALLASIFSGSPLSSEPPVVETSQVPQEDLASSPTADISDKPVDGSADSCSGEDAQYREKYFPGIGPEETFCSLCASRGHDTAGCPNMSCRFCGDSEHRSFNCPTRSRCLKCRQLGHVKRDCSEKLALPQEDVECAFCESRGDHVDASCHEIWRSFLSNPDTVRKVRSLPIFCYCCGREGHFGPVCGLNPQKSKESVWETWSQANCDRYLDPASSEVAIIWASPGSGPSSERPDLGKSIVPNRHIFFEEADDDDEADEFIRPPVQKAPRVGNISFSGSNGAGNRGGRRPSKQYGERNGRSGYTQPPLPPGPPPPLPRRNGGRPRGGGARY